MRPPALGEKRRSSVEPPPAAMSTSGCALPGPAASLHPAARPPGRTGFLSRQSAISHASSHFPCCPVLLAYIARLAWESSPAVDTTSSSSPPPNATPVGVLVRFFFTRGLLVCLGPRTASCSANVRSTRSSQVVATVLESQLTATPVTLSWWPCRVPRKRGWECLAALAPFAPCFLASSLACRSEMVCFLGSALAGSLLLLGGTGVGA
mmetsp:Transcript_6414/g.16460  ORF Transcript_6414/g.16460 Transcript_6414/m.16460 type:complete len:208 (-) Transcript_6414:281-904(-)